MSSTCFISLFILFEQYCLMVTMERSFDIDDEDMEDEKYLKDLKKQGVTIEKGVAVRNLDSGLIREKIMDEYVDRLLEMIPSE